MRKSEWSDKELIDLLKQMPKIEDYRHPRDIYQNLSRKKRKNVSWLLPGIAAAAALFLFFILAPKFMDTNHYSLNNAKQESTKEVKIAKDNSDAGGMANQESQTGQISTLKKAEGQNDHAGKTAVYDDEIKDGVVLTYWIPDNQALNLVPVSTIVKNTEGKDWLTLYNEHMANLNESEWGLSEFYPLQATLHYDNANETVIVDVPSDHPYRQGSATEQIFLGALKNDISSNSSVKTIKFTTNGEPGIELSNDFLEKLTITDVKKHAYLFYYPNGSDVPFLVPTPESYKDIKAAIDAMKSVVEEYQLQRSLLPNLAIQDVSANDNTLTITFAKDASLEDERLAVWSMEAILLTAKEFGFEKVVVSNPPAANIGSFDLTKEIKVPAAPNLRTIEK